MLRETAVTQHMCIPNPHLLTHVCVCSLKLFCSRVLLVCRSQDGLVKVWNLERRRACAEFQATGHGNGVQKLDRLGRRRVIRWTHVPCLFLYICFLSLCTYFRMISHVLLPLCALVVWCATQRFAVFPFAQHFLVSVRHVALRFVRVFEVLQGSALLCRGISPT